MRGRRTVHARRAQMDDDAPDVRRRAPYDQSLDEVLDTMAAEGFTEVRIKEGGHVVAELIVWPDGDGIRWTNGSLM